MYMVIEMQLNDGHLAYLATVHETLAAAEQKYHQILSAAAVSQVDVHSAVILDARGVPWKNETYDHTQEGGEDDAE